jgi:hypothetical protein
MKQHTNIAAALAAAQAEMGKALKQTDNPHFRSKYADLGNVMDACMPALNANGIAVMQPFIASEFGNRVATVFLHESGERLETEIPLILGKQDMQGLGSAITYARRYGLMCLAGIAPEDDDGNAAAQNAPKRKPAEHGEAIKDAWRQSVMDSLPEDATPEQTAKAFAAAICEDFASKKGIQSLENSWSKHEKMIKAMQSGHRGLWEAIVDAFEKRKNELSPSESEAIPG